MITFIKKIKDKIYYTLQMLLLKVVFESTEETQELIEVISVIEKKQELILKSLREELDLVEEEEKLNFYQNLVQKIKNLQVFIKENLYRIHDKKLKTIILNLEELLELILKESTKTKSLHDLFNIKLEDKEALSKFLSSKFIMQEIALKVVFTREKKQLLKKKKRKKKKSRVKKKVS